MNRVAGVGLIWGLVLLAGIAPPASAQAPEAGQQAVAHEHSPFVAGLVEWILPTAGFAYAGDWKRGLAPNAARVGGMVLLLSTYDEDTEDCPAACAVGAVAFLGGTVWAIYGAVVTAKDHNGRLRAAASRMDLGPGPEGSLSMGLRFTH